MMTIPFWCLFAVLMMPLLLAFVGGYFRGKQFGQADNKNPRAQVARLEGTGARAYAAQANAWEAATLFAPAVLVAHLAGVPAESAAPWTIAFVVFRVLHAGFYLADIDMARSASFMGGMVCVVALFVKAA
ncbi:MAG: MAPEG family protein [Spirochaetaceae bacterium]|nr:MAPEG family protein [Myxococcales bacterium]MCB9723582.1 MAPEG family protein [Spirochaetaceae bacterium]HPG24899.1 MAPEG family protein [Myxococcota bacterium]